MANENTPFQGVMTGRLVQGDCFVAQTKDAQGNLRVVKTGPNAGQPAPQYFVAVAYRKDDPEWPAFFNLLLTTSKQEWPNLFPATSPAENLFGVMHGKPVNPQFSFKVVDGDGLDQNGKSNSDKEGFAGHWVVRYASSYAPKVVRPTGPGTWEVMAFDPATGQKSPIKRGDYIRVAGSVAGNNNPQRPGIYVNLNMIEFVGQGDEIVGGPDAATAFATPAQLPPGARPVGAPPVGGAPAPTPPATGGAPMPPATGNAPVAPAAPAAPPPAAPSVAAPSATTSPSRTMTAAANGVSYEAFIAQGWTDQQLIDSGMMQAPASYSGFREAPLDGAPANPATSVAAPSAPPAPSAAAPSATTSPSRTMTAAANGVSYEAFIAQGWTDQQLIDGGYMTA